MDVQIANSQSFLTFSQFSAMESPILQIENLNKQFGDPTNIVIHNISFNLPTGAILGLLGPSGCGKTTLLRTIAGFEQPEQGKITIGSKIVCDRKIYIPPEQRNLGIVFQDYALFPHLNVWENIAFGLKSSDRPQQNRRVSEVLKLVRLQGLEKRYPYELSGGQQQRVALARAVAPQPQILLLDEPLSNLDIQIRVQLRQEIRAIIKAAGISAIFVTHDREEALSISDLVGVMQRGNLEQLGTPEEIYLHPASQFVAEFVSQTNLFLAQRRGNGWETEIGYFELPSTCLDDVGKMAIRPEDAILTPAEDGVLSIRSRSFLGREYLYTLETPSGKLLTTRETIDRVLPVGARVNVKIASPNLTIFPESDAE
jgi:iron(III) transport system ATP-binding protein